MNVVGGHLLVPSLGIREQANGLLQQLNFFFFGFVLFGILRQGFSPKPWLFWNSVCTPDWPGSHRDQPF